MKAALYYNNSDVRLVNITVPVISEDEILIKTQFCGICGSDVMEWYRIKKAPLVLGHEMTGTIEEVGKNITQFKPGQRVFVSHHIPCFECYYCLNNNHTACDLLHTTNYDPGGFSEYIRIPKINIEKNAIFELPKEVSFEQGAFIEPLACVMRGQKLLALNRNHTYTIIGCGMSGLLFIKLLNHLKIKRIIAIDINEFRLNKALEYGASTVLNAKEDTIEKIKESNDNRLSDVVIVCTGAEAAAKNALNIIERGGQILFFAVPKPNILLNVPINDFWRKEISIKTSYGAAPIDLQHSLNFIKEKKILVDDLITHKLPLEKIQEGFQLAAKANSSLKVLIDFTTSQ